MYVTYLSVGRGIVGALQGRMWADGTSGKLS